ncbi:MAG: extensin family protein [Polyangiales bacterium]
MTSRVAAVLALALTAASCAAQAQTRAPHAGGWYRVAQSLGLVDAPEARARHQWEHLASADGAACRAALRAAGVRFTSLPDRERPDARGCGIPHPVIVTRGPTGMRWEGVRVDCSFALTLPAVERVIQEEAHARLHTAVRAVGTLGSYNCRPVRGGVTLSEHALGNAVDVARFTLARGRAVSVARDYPSGVREPDARGGFLLAVQSRLREEAGFSRLRGPDTDALHRDHFHLDRAPSWWRW